MPALLLPQTHSRLGQLARHSCLLLVQYRTTHPLKEDGVSASEHRLPDRGTQKHPNKDFQHIKKAKAVKHSALRSTIPPGLTTEEHEAAAGLSWEHTACADGFKLAQGQCSFSVGKQP